MKSLKDISWQVTEEEYRADPALSYSTLARYEREGFNNLDKLFDRIETPSLVFGSAVDALITGGMEEFESRFMLASFPAIPDSIIAVVKGLFNKYSNEYSSLYYMEDEKIIQVTEELKYQPNWRPETRAKVLREKGGDYYTLLYVAGNKTILDTETYNDVMRTCEVLKTSEATRKMFKQDSPFDSVERLYQLKFKGTFNGVTYRNMADLIIVHHQEKLIIPIDLKTSSKPEWDFYKSFIDWRYDIQARLYWHIIRQNLDKDEYFKDFKLADYHFVVINRRTLTPLVWQCPFTQAVGTQVFGENNQIKLRSPFEIGEELSSYLTKGHIVPNGISKDGINDIRTWLNKL